MGTLTPLGTALYGWTDLWLDVIMPEPATSYQLLDATEFATALREGHVSPAVAALALDQLDALVQLIHRGQFPPPEVRQAERVCPSASPALRPGLAPCAPSHPGDDSSGPKRRDYGGVAGQVAGARHAPYDQRHTVIALYRFLLYPGRRDVPLAVVSVLPDRVAPVGSQQTVFLTGAILEGTAQWGTRWC